MNIKVAIGAGTALVAALGGAAYLIFGKDIFKKADKPAPKNEEKKEPEKTEEPEE